MKHKKGQGTPHKMPKGKKGKKNGGMPSGKGSSMSPAMMKKMKAHMKGMM